jgi:acetoin utilization protein AcuB/CBS domain-containing protein
MYPTDSISTEQQIIDWMHTPAITQKLGASVDAALAVMREYNLQHLPIVLDTGELCGMLTQGDIRGAEILRFAGLDPQTIADALRRLKVYDVLSERLIVATTGTSLREAALLMLENKIGSLPVVDSSGDVVGIITESDILRAFVAMVSAPPAQWDGAGS